MKMTLTNRPKAYSYLRFSTPEQMKGDSHDRQWRAAVDYADKHGLDLDTNLTFKDLGVSAFRGKNAETGQLKMFLRAIEDGVIEEGSYLLVENLDRMSRQGPWEALPLFQQIINEGVTIVTLQDSKVWSKAELRENPYRIMESIIVMIRANEESATKARRVKAAWATKRARAKDTKLTALTPSWLTLLPDRKSFELDEKKAAVVRRIFDMTLQGVGQHKIAETFNQEGVPVFGRGKLWHRTFVAKLLAYEGVIGVYEPCTIEYVDGKKRRKPAEKVPGYYPAIIDERAFRDVQARLAAKAPRGRHANGKAPIRNIFAGIARCPLCDGTMTLLSKDSTRDERYLVCTKAKAGAGCTYKAVRYSWVERAVLDNTGAWAGPGLDDASDSPHHAEITKARAQISAIGDAIDGILSTFGAHGSPAAAAKVRELEAERDAVEATIATLEDKAAEANGAIVEARIAAVLKATANGEDRGAINLALKTAVERVVIDHTALEARFHWRHGPVTACAYGWQG